MMTAADSYVLHSAFTVKSATESHGDCHSVTDSTATAASHQVDSSHDNRCVGPQP